jgi:hypothetical protein
MAERLTVDQDVEGSKPFSHPLFLNQDVAPEGCIKDSKPFSHPLFLNQDVAPEGCIKGSKPFSHPLLIKVLHPKGVIRVRNPSATLSF